MRWGLVCIMIWKDYHNSRKDLCFKVFLLRRQSMFRVGKLENRRRGSWLLLILFAVGLACLVCEKD